MRNKVLIIAEAGVNHNGDFELAKQLIAVAADSGADYVKFQTYKTDKFVAKTAGKAVYQINNTKDNNSQYEMLKKLEMPEQWHFDLVHYANSLGIKFLSTAFDQESIDFLDKLNIPLFKVPSGEITNKLYLAHIAKIGKPVILSTGMADLQDIKSAIEILTSKNISKEMITVLHCNTEYPTPMSDVNLKAMDTIKQELNVKVGYSDHTLGVEVSIAAVALGASVIEKHFTLDRCMAGPDHLASLEPAELKAMVTAIRNIELAISGDGKKEPSISELKNKAIARKSLHLKCKLGAGHILTEEDLDAKRPGDGISPMRIHEVLGKRIKRELPSEHKLTPNDFE